MEPVSLGAVGAMAGAGLLQQLLQAQMQKEADAKAAKQRAIEVAQAAVQQGQNTQIQLAGTAADREQNALQAIVQAFQNSAR